MATLLKRIFKNKVALYIIIVIIAFLPFTITNPAESDNKVLAVALGFDKVADEIEVSAQFIVPEFSQGFQMKLKAISAKSKTPAEAIEKISLYLGKNIGLAHCDVIVIGNGYADEDIGKTFDYLLRGKKVGKNSSLIYTEGTAKNLIQKTVDINKNMDLTLKKILNFNNNIVFAKQNTVDGFLNNYFTEDSISFASVINIKNEGGVALQPQSSSNGGGTQGEMNSGSNDSSANTSQSSSKEEMIVNDGSTALFKKGKLVKVLVPDEVRAFNWIKDNSSVSVKLENVTTEMLDNAEMVIQVINKNTSFAIDFKNNKPVVKAKLNLLVELNSIKNSDQFIIKNINKSFINEVVENKLKMHILNDISKALNIAKENNVDFFYFYDMFYKYKNKELKNYVKTLNNIDDFLSNVQLFVEINISKTV